MQGNFAFINCLYIIETDHVALADTENIKSVTGKRFHVDKDDGETTRPDIDVFLSGIVSNIKAAISLHNEITNISEIDVVDSDGQMGCPSEVITEILCGYSGKGLKQRKYTIQLVLRAGYYCCYNLDFNVIQYNSDNNIININRGIKFTSKIIISVINAVIEIILNIFKTHASEAFIDTVMSNGQTCYKYVTPQTNQERHQNSHAEQ